MTFYNSVVSPLFHLLSASLHPLQSSISLNLVTICIYICICFCICTCICICICVCILFCVLAPLQSSIWLNWASLIDFDPASKAYQIFIIIEALSHFPTKPNTEFKPKCYISKIWLHQLIRYTENEKFNYGSERICINWLNDDTASSSRWHYLKPVIKVCCDKLKLFPNCHDLRCNARI